MHYTSKFIPHWDCSNPKKLFIGLLIPMVERLWSMELDGCLEETASPPRHSSDPRSKEDADRFADPALRREALEAAMALVWAINTIDDHPVLERMVNFVEIPEDVAIEFEGDLWALLLNYIFLLGRSPNGRNVEDFIRRAASLLEMELEQASEGPETCACCDEPVEVIH